MTNKQILAALIILDRAANYCYTSLGEESKLGQDIDLVRSLIANQIDDEGEI